MSTLTVLSANQGDLPLINPIRTTLVAEQADELHFTIPGTGIRLETNVDCFPGNSYAQGKVMIRVPTQSSCLFNCHSCSATGSGKNLSADAIIYQVNYALNCGIVDPHKIANLVVAFMGLGEPLVNMGVAEAIRELHYNAKTPRIHFIVSTSGPRATKVLTELLVLRAEGVTLDLQVSNNSMSELARTLHLNNLPPADTLPEGFRPIPALSIQGLGDLACTWFNGTGNKAIINIVVGEGFACWNQVDFDEFERVFPWKIATVKLSLEGRSSKTKEWNPDMYKKRIAHYASVLVNRHYKCDIYIPPGVGIGASCGVTSNPAELP